MALAIVAVLLGLPALPLAWCAAEAGEIHCSDKIARDATPPHGCHDVEAPPAALSCCCDDDANVPVTPPTSSDGASAAASSVVSALDDDVPRRELRAVAETAGLTADRRPLFKLFSAFLI